MPTTSFNLSEDVLEWLSDKSDLSGISKSSLVDNILRVVISTEDRQSRFILEKIAEWRTRGLLISQGMEAKD